MTRILQALAKRAVLFSGLTLLCGAAVAQDLAQSTWGVLTSRGARDPVKTGTPAKELFGGTTAPAPLAARAIGSYSRGCLAGGVALPVDGPAWQVMRLSRNRNWGHPLLVAYLEQLAKDASSIGWPGLLIGDMAQPRGGPMLTGHASHQIGLDADIWLTPMPNRTLTRDEREQITAVSMLRDPLNVDLNLWTPTNTQLIRLAASYSVVDRIFVHPAIKQVLCDQAGRDRRWLSKVRPWWGHYYHFHVRLGCPRGSQGRCRSQSPVSGGDGCGTELDDWFHKLRVSEMQPAPPSKPERPLSLGDLPQECRVVLTSGGNAPIPKRNAADTPAGPPPPHFQYFRSGISQPSSNWGE
ncbi:MAG: penicillin-insensitive murein endopeptidase [Methyloceanibacter sp.]